MQTKTIRLGGVPEHFNLPIHLAIENGSFASRGVNIEWTTFKGGTGQMTQALRNGEVDACILLTEGIIKDIIAGNPSQIISGYVNTPLIWGIHTGSQNSLQYHREIYDKQYAISRFGSGSHLMAMVDANTRGQKLTREQFTPIKNLDGALESLTNLSTDVFYWEKFMTKPFVDNGQLRRIGEFITPWPCFVIAVREEVLKLDTASVKTILEIINTTTIEFKNIPSIDQMLANRYGQQLEDVRKWLSITQWSQEQLSNVEVARIQNTLKALDLIEAPKDPSEILHFF